MSKIAICAPYVKNELTLAAINFANHLTASGLDVDFLVDGKVQHELHPFWDTHVRSGTNPKSLDKWINAARHVCWFSLPTNKIASVKAKQQKPDFKLKNWLFLSFQPFDSKLATAMRWADGVVCLGSPVSEWLSSKSRPRNRRQLVVDPIAYTASFKQRDGFLTNKQRHLLIVLDNSTTRDLGVAWLKMVDELLASHTGLHVTFASPVRLSREMSLAIRSRCGERVVFAESVAYGALADMSHAHDWTYLAMTRFFNGATLCTLKLSSSPVFGHGWTREFLDVACRIHYASRPVADVEIAEIKSRIDTLLHSSVSQLRRMQMAATAQAKRDRLTYERFIAKVFLE